MYSGRSGGSDPQAGTVLYCTVGGPLFATPRDWESCCMLQFEGLRQSFRIIRQHRLIRSAVFFGFGSILKARTFRFGRFQPLSQK